MRDRVEKTGMFAHQLNKHNTDHTSSYFMCAVPAYNRSDWTFHIQNPQNVLCFMNVVIGYLLYDAYCLFKQQNVIQSVFGNSQICAFNWVVVLREKGHNSETVNVKYTVIEFNLYLMIHSIVLKFEKIWLSLTLNIIRKPKKSLFSKRKRALTQER